MSTVMDDSVARESKGSYAKTDDYLKANNLIYRMPADLSVASSRKLIKSTFQQSRYRHTNSATVILNSGDAMIDGRNSYLQFKLERKSEGVATTGRTTTFGSGSALNLIRQVTITTANGVEIDRVDGVNLIYYDFLKYSKPADWFTSTGSVMGYEGAVPVSVVHSSTPTSETYCIPLRYLNGLFASDKLLYSGIMSGMKIEINWEDPDVAFVTTANYTASDYYEVVDPVVVLDSHMLHDFAAKSLHIQSSSSNDGLELTFSTFDRQTGTLASSETRLTQQSRKALTRAGFAWMKPRLSANVLGGQPTALADSFRSEQNRVSSYQYNLGSLYFPNQRIDDKKEMFMNALYSFSELSRAKYPSIGYTAFNATDSVFPVVLEKSTILESTGLPLISGRCLNIEATFSTEVQRNVDVIIQYTKLVKIFLTNAVVKQ